MRRAVRVFQPRWGLILSALACCLAAACSGSKRAFVSAPPPRQKPSLPLITGEEATGDWQGAQGSVSAIALISAAAAAGGAHLRQRRRKQGGLRRQATPGDSSTLLEDEAPPSVISEAKLPSTVEPEGTPEEGTPEEGSEEEPSFLNPTTGALLLVVLAVLYGGNVPLLKCIETETPLDVTAPEILTFRFLAASVVIAPWMLANIPKVIAVFLPATELAFWLWSGYTLQILGLEKTSASLSAVIIALAGVTVQVLEIVVDRKPLRPVIAASSVGVIGGLALFATAPGGAQNPVGTLVNRTLGFLSSLLEQAKPLPHEVILDGVPGAALGVVGAMLFGVHVWRCNCVVKKVGDNEFALAAVQIFITTFFAAVFGLLDTPYTLEEQLNSVERLGFTVWLQVVACGVICTGLPALLELFAFKVVPPAIASLIYCTIPLWGTLLGVVFLGDQLGPQSTAGGVIILLSALAPSVASFMAASEAEESS